MKFKELREKYRSKFPSSLVAAAVKIALDMSGNMTGAYKKIEAMKRGLANDPMVKDALRQANESVNEETVKLVDMDDDSHQTALKLAQKAGVKVVSKKTKTGTELSVSGSNKKIGKFMMSLPESVKEGTMAIGIFDRDKSKAKKAIADMQKLIKGKQNVKVGSPEGKKIGNKLDMDLLSDDELADDFMDPKNKGMSIKDLLKKHSKRLGLNIK